MVHNGWWVGLRFQGVPIRWWLEFHFQTPGHFSNRLPRYITRSLPRVIARCRDIESLHLRGGGGLAVAVGRLALCGYPWIFFVFFIKEFPSGIFGDSRESLFVNSKTFGNTRSSGWSQKEDQWTPRNNLTSEWQKHETSTACLADDLRCWQDGCSLDKIDVLQAALKIR